MIPSGGERGATMRGDDGACGSLFSYIDLEKWVRADHPLRVIREVERIEYDLLFRWFVGLGIEDAVWDATTFTKNRDRLLEGDMAAQFLAAVLSQDKVKGLLSSE